MIKVHQKQNKGLSWNRAMDEVHVEKLIWKYKDSGELDSEDPALLMLKKWPASEQYKDNPDKLRGLEQLVCWHLSFSELKINLLKRRPSGDWTFFFSSHMENFSRQKARVLSWLRWLSKRWLHCMWGYELRWCLFHFQQIPTRENLSIALHRSTVYKNLTKSGYILLHTTSIEHLRSMCLLLTMLLIMRFADKSVFGDSFGKWT